MSKKATEQANVSPISGVAPPVHSQFGQPNGNPRHSGAWKKEDTARFKLERMMELTAEQLQAVIDDKSTPLFEHKLATAIQNGEWREIKEMMEQVYGKPKESVDMNHSGDVTFINTVPRAKIEND